MRGDCGAAFGAAIAGGVGAEVVGTGGADIQRTGTEYWSAPSQKKQAQDWQEKAPEGDDDSTAYTIDAATDFKVGAAKWVFGVRVYQVLFNPIKISGEGIPCVSGRTGILWIVAVIQRDELERALARDDPPFLVSGSPFGAIHCPVAADPKGDNCEEEEGGRSCKEDEAFADQGMVSRASQEPPDCHPVLHCFRKSSLFYMILSLRIQSMKLARPVSTWVLGW
jgi:hypothetical protein